MRNRLPAETTAEKSEFERLCTPQITFFGEKTLGNYRGAIKIFDNVPCLFGTVGTKWPGDYV